MAWALSFESAGAITNRGLTVSAPGLRDEPAVMPIFAIGRLLLASFVRLSVTMLARVAPGGCALRCRRRGPPREPCAGLLQHLSRSSSTRSSRGCSEYLPRRWMRPSIADSGEDIDLSRTSSRG